MCANLGGRSPAQVGSPGAGHKHRRPGTPSTGRGMAEPSITDPFAHFAAWYEEAGRSEPCEPSAMTLATATRDGIPSARVVLLKGFDPAGFVFYTNLESRKSAELAINPHAALCFHWKS